MSLNRQEYLISNLIKKKIQINQKHLRIYEWKMIFKVKFGSIWRKITLKCLMTMLRGPSLSWMQQRDCIRSTPMFKSLEVHLDD